MTEIPAVSMSHMGLFVHDMDRMVDFYTRVLGFVETDRGQIRGHDIVFLTRDADEDHQLTLESGRPAELDHNNLQQISLKAESLDGLRRLYAALEKEPVSKLHSVTHGTAWSLYYWDLEGNRTEIFVETPWYVTQTPPVYDKIDLSRSDDDLLRETETRYDGRTTPWPEWRADIAKKLGTGL